MFTRQKATPVPEVGEQAPGFNLPSAQGGKLVLSMRTVRGPVIVVFYRPNNEDDVEYFKALAAVEDEVNLAAASIVGVGIAEPDEARTLLRESGIKSYVLYDYVRVTSREWGLYEKNKELGEYSRPAVFIVGMDHDIVHAWTDERPEPSELLAKTTGITGLPKAPEEPEEKPDAEEATKGDETAPKKLTAEDREKIKAERRAAREAGQSLKISDAKTDGDIPEAAPPKKLTAEEREKIKAERRAAREAGQSLKKPPDTEKVEDQAETEATPPASEAAPKKISREEREKIKAERRVAREAGETLKKPQEPAPEAETTTEPAAESAPTESEPTEGGAPKKMSREERERIKAERRAAREAGKSLKKPEPKSEEEG